MTEQGESTPTLAASASRPASVSSPAELVAARQASGLGASDIAAKLGMATRQVEALERGDWQALPGQAFVRGALRAYGKTLDVDIEPLLASLGGQVRAPELRASASLDSPMPRGGGLGFGGGGSGSRLAWIVLGIAAVIAIVFYFGPAFDTDGADAPSAGGTASTSQPAPAGASQGSAEAAASAGSTSGGAASAGAAGGTGGASATAAPPAAAASGPAASSAQPSLAPLTPLAPAGSSTSGSPTTGSPASGAGAAPAAGAAGPVTASQAGAAGTSASVPAGMSASGAAVPSADKPASDVETLRFRFGRESWVEIREAGGKVLLTGIQPAGTERELTGRKPLSLVIGNAEHVTLERGGQRVDLAGRARQGVARLTLD